MKGKTENLEYRINQLERVLQEVADNTEDKKLLSIIEKGIIIKNDRKDKWLIFYKDYYEFYKEC
mgnify:CR=1 FL=1